MAADYQVFVERGISAREQKDNAQWILGSLAWHVVIIWGESTLKKYANDINIAYSTLRTYRQICIFYFGNEIAPRGAFDHAVSLRGNPILSFTHFKYAMRFDDIEMALSFLDECIDEAWCTDLAYAKIDERLGKPQQPALVGEFDSAEQAIRYLRTNPGHYIVKIYKRSDTVGLSSVS